MLTLTEYRKVFQYAQRAGKSALEKCVPKPMVVQEVGLDDQPYEGSQTWIVEDGVCGFAWVTVYAVDGQKIHRGRKIFYPFIDVLRQAGFKWDSYEKNFKLWVTAGNQSMTKKEAFGEAYVKVLNENGIEAYMGSRMD